MNRSPKISELVEVLLDRGKFTRREAIAVALGSIAFSLLFCYPLIGHLRVAGTLNDWDYISASQWAAYWTVDQYHQFPLWNPFECGGMPLLGDPQSHLLTPWFFLTMMFGVVVGLHLEVILYCAIGWAGGYVLGRVLGLRRISAICTATAFAGSSWFFLRASEGQFPFLGMAYLPWILAAGWAASERGKLRYALLCGALIAMSFFEGGPYPPLFGGLTLALVMAGKAALRLSPRPLIALALAAVFAAGFGAVKFAPAIQVIQTHPHPTDQGYSNTIYALTQGLFSRNQDRNRFGVNAWGFWESGAYVGLFALIALAALRFPRSAFPWVIAGIFLFYAARGYTDEQCVWVWLHRLPMFSSTRLPSRILIPFVLMVAVLAGIGIDAICNRGSPVTLAVSVLLVVIGGVDMLLVGPFNLQWVLTNVCGPGPSHGEFVQSRRVGAVPQSAVIRDHNGVVNCYVGIDWPTTVKGLDDPDYRGEEYLLDAGTVRRTRWSPNRLEYAVDAPKPSVLVVNQNYDPSWRVTSGPGQILSQDGLLAVRVPAGKSRIVLRYVSIAFICGLLITILTGLLAFALFRREQRSPEPG